MLTSVKLPLRPTHLSCSPFLRSLPFSPRHLLPTFRVSEFLLLHYILCLSHMFSSWPLTLSSLVHFFFSPSLVVFLLVMRIFWKHLASLSWSFELTFLSGHFWSFSFSFPSVTFGNPVTLTCLLLHRSSSTFPPLIIPLSFNLPLYSIHESSWISKSTELDWIMLSFFPSFSSCYPHPFSNYKKMNVYPTKENKLIADS